MHQQLLFMTRKITGGTWRQHNRCFEWGDVIGCCGRFVSVQPAPVNVQSVSNSQSVRYSQAEPIICGSAFLSGNVNRPDGDCGHRRDRRWISHAIVSLLKLVCLHLWTFHLTYLHLPVQKSGAGHLNGRWCVDAKLAQIDSHVRCGVTGKLKMLYDGCIVNWSLVIRVISHNLRIRNTLKWQTPWIFLFIWFSSLHSSLPP